MGRRPKDERARGGKSPFRLVRTLSTTAVFFMRQNVCCPLVQFGRSKKDGAHIKQPEYVVDAQETYRRKCVATALKVQGPGGYVSLLRAAIGRVNPRRVQGARRWDVKV